MDPRSSLPPYERPENTARYSIHEGDNLAPLAPLAPSDATSSDLPPENIALTWRGDQIMGPVPVVEAQLAQLAVPSTRPEIPTILPPRSPSPVERPPDYAQAQRPRTNVSYSFSPLDANSMVLLPPASAQDSRPQYYITVSMNCFMPLSHITTVYRGANEYGARVGDFEMGIIATPSRVQMVNQAAVPIARVLSKSGSRTAAQWTWSPVVGRPGTQRRNLRWDYTHRPFTCVSQGKVVAKFSPHLGIQFGLNNQLSQLEIIPDGQEQFDDILISLLIIERKRLTPRVKSESELKNLFN